MCSADPGDARAAPRHRSCSRRCRAKVGAQPNPMLALERLAQSERRLRDRRSAPTGSSSTPRSARHRRAGATAPSSSGSASSARSISSIRMRAPNSRCTLDVLIQQKSKAFARMGVPNLFARPGYVAFYRELANVAALPSAGSFEPPRRRRDLGGAQSRAHVPRLLLSYPGELRRRRGLALRARRRAPARTAALRDRARAQALRFHHRRRALQARLVRHRTAAVRLFGRRDLARLARDRAVARMAARQARDQADRAALERRGPPARGRGLGAQASRKSED